MKKILSPFVCIIATMLFFNVNAQVFDWAKQIDGEGWWNEGQANSIAIDSLGNIYTVGYFIGTMDFDPGEAVYNLSTSDHENTYFQKLDTEGNLVWAHHMVSVAENKGSFITISDSGYIYLCGYFNGETDFDPGEGTFIMNSTSGYDIYLAKYDLSANLIWAVQMSGAATAYPTSVQTDHMGNVYTVGYYYGSGDFDPGASVYTLEGHDGASFFVTKLNPSGHFVWARGVGGTADNVAYSLAIASDLSIYVTGYFAGSSDFDPDMGGQIFTSLGSNDIFVQKLNHDGGFMWVKQMGGTEADGAKAIALGTEGDIHLAGYFTGTCDFDPNEGNQFLTSFGSQDIFVEKLDADGGFIWAKQMGAPENNSDKAYAMTLDEEGNVFTTGVFSGIADFDPGPAVVNLYGVSQSDVFIHKLDMEGNFMWAKQIGGTGFESGLGIKLDASQNIFTAGYFTETPDFDPGEGVFTMTSGGGNSIFIHKLNNCEESYSTLMVSACEAYESPSGHSIWTISGTYFDTIPNVAGCDSLITIELTIISIDTGVSLINNTLTANQFGATYQWVICDAGYAWINGATQQSFTPQENGNYAVILTVDDCQDTSSCYQITGLAIQQKNLTSTLTVSPNPTNGLMRINSTNPVQKVVIYNSLGQRIKELSENSLDFFINLSDQKPGLYFLEFAVGNQRITPLYKVQVY